MTGPESAPRTLPLADAASGAEGLPELDARVIPHAIRHGAVFGALGQVPVGKAMVLVAPHDPLPLLAQIQDREGAAVEFSYLQRGPDAWRLKLARVR